MATQQNSAVSSQANATFEIKAHMVDYFRRHLLPAAQPPPTPQAAAPPVRYYRMGAVGEEDPPAPGNDWREASDWPIPGGREKTPFGGRKVLKKRLLVVGRFCMKSYHLPRQARDKRKKN
jgi:hypothetical protein